MSIREQLAKGIFETSQTPIVEETFEWNVPESNPFAIKNRKRLQRMQKSAAAREHRHMIRDIKQKRHQLGYHNYSL